MITSLALSMIGSAPASAQDTGTSSPFDVTAEGAWSRLTYETTPSEAAAMVEEELGILRSYAADGSFTYIVPEGVDTPTSFREGPVTWTYDGQLRVDLRGGAVRTTTARTLGKRGDIVGTLRIDIYGRRWVATAVDTPALTTLEATRAARFPEAVHPPASAVLLARMATRSPRRSSCSAGPP